MTAAQAMWWRQARSDFELFDRLRRLGIHPCHTLHYVQMASEKVSKAYLWRSGKAPPKAHTGFRRFLKALLDRPTGELERIAVLFGFARESDFERWVTHIQPLAYDLERLAPAEAANGPNPEYPWPHANPVHYPAGFEFPVWDKLKDTGEGRKLITFIRAAIDRFPEYA